MLLSHVNYTLHNSYLCFPIVRYKLCRTLSHLTFFTDAFSIPRSSVQNHTVTRHCLLLFSLHYFVILLPHFNPFPRLAKHNFFLLHFLKLANCPFPPKAIFFINFCINVFAHVLYDDFNNNDNNNNQII